MEKTLIELVKTNQKNHVKVMDLEAKRDVIYAEMNAVNGGIEERFKPKHWQRYEFIITEPAEFDYPNNTLDFMNRGELPYKRFKIPRLKAIHVGRKFKCDFIRLVTTYLEDGVYKVMWEMSGLIQLKSGDYGKEKFSFKFVDKVELVD